MLNITINGAEYFMKTNLKEITIKEYFQILDIEGEKHEMPPKEENKLVSGEYIKEYYAHGEEPDDIRWKQNNRIVAIISNIPLELLNNTLELGEIVAGNIESLLDDTPAWSKKEYYETISSKVKIDGKTKIVEELVKSENFAWILDEPSDWSFQQWVDTENSSRLNYIYPFVLNSRKCKVIDGKLSKTKRVYNKGNPDFQEKLDYWENQPAEGNINTIFEVHNKIRKVRELFFWIYEAESRFPEKGKKTSKIYMEFAGWNDVVVSLTETNAFNSSKGTLHAVRTANCIDVLEFLNWKQGKAFAEYEDYKLEEFEKNKGTLIG